MTRLDSASASGSERPLLKITLLIVFYFDVQNQELKMKMTKKRLGFTLIGCDLLSAL